MKKIIILLSFSLLIGGLRAQNPSIVPESKVSTPANFSTGAPKVSIPLWNAKSGNISAPVYLSYATNGIKVSEQSGFMGLGWKFVAGGAITQIVRGKAGSTVTIPEVEQITQGYMKDVFEGETDAEPDYYSFGAPGIGGTFYFDSDGSINTTSKSYLDITQVPAPDGGDDVFRIIDGYGIVYSFNTIARTVYHHEDGTETTIKKWLLTEIKTSDEVNSISFEYERMNFLCLGDAYVLTSTNLYSEGNIDKLYTEPLVEQVYLKSITTRNEKVEFNYAPMIDDDYTPKLPPLKIPPDSEFDPELDYLTEHILESVNILNKANELLKTYTFRRRCSGTRYFLTGVNEFGGNDGALPGYTFSYYNISSLPDPTSSSIDFWGYYNDNTNADNLTQYASRWPSASKTYIGMLKRVYYPTGAYIEYEYEPNTYNYPFDYSDGWEDEKWKTIVRNLKNRGEITDDYSHLLGPGVRVSKITKSELGSTDVLITEYGYDEGVISSGRLSVYPVIDYDILLSDIYSPQYPKEEKLILQLSNSLNIEPGFVIYKKVTEYTGGKNPSTNNGNNGRIEYSFDTKPPVVLIAEGDILGDLPHPFPYQIKYFEKEYNGHLLEKKVFDKDDNIKLSETNEYTQEIVVNPTICGEGLKVALVKIQLRVHGRLDLYTAMKYDIFHRNVLLDRTTSRTYFNGNLNDYSEKVVDYTYTRGIDKYLMPTEITTTESNGDAITVYMYYPEDLTSDAVCNEMVNRNIVSPVIKKETFKNSQQLSGSNTIFGLEAASNGNNMIVPVESQVWVDGNYETQSFMDEFDTESGALLQAHGRDNINITTLYAYNGTLPVATVTNLDYTTINGIINVANLRDNYNTASIESTLNTLRSAINASYPNAFITCTLYEPLRGKIKTIDTNGRFMTYEYDEFGRLVTVKDQNGVVLKHNEYHAAE